MTDSVDQSSSDEMHAWYQTKLGQYFFTQEASRLVKALSKLPGNCLVQVGEMANMTWLDMSRFTHHQVLSAQDFEACIHEGVSNNDALPLATESVDVLLLSHTLELSINVKAQLQEASKLLREGGSLVVLGFNPWSVWGLSRLLNCDSHLPGLLYSHSQNTLRESLAAMGFRDIYCKSFCYNGPFSSEAWLKRCQWIEPIGKGLWPYCGAGYMLVAKKTHSVMTPLREKWNKENKKIRTNVAEPTMRDNQS